MNIRILAASFISLFPALGLQSQIISGSDTLYGNEWIRFDQPYFKIPVAEDGIHRVSHQTLSDAGLPLGTIPGSQFQLFRNGQEVPLHLSTDNLLGPGDYLEFFGQRNTSELDRHLFKNPDVEMMNPLYSLVTDTAAYFLTWGTAGGAAKRYLPTSNDLANLPPKEPYYLATLVNNYFSHFHKQRNAQSISLSDFQAAEGFSTNYSNSATYSLSPSFHYPDNDLPAELHIRYSCNIGAHDQAVSLNDQPLATEQFQGFQVRQVNAQVANQLLQNTLTVKIQGLASSSDNHRLANLVLTYPRQFKFGNQPYFIFDIAASDAVRYLEIEDFNDAGEAPVLYDLTNHLRLVPASENGLLKIALPPSSLKRSLVLVNPSLGVKLVPSLQPVNFIDYQGLNADYVILSNPRLYNDGNGNNFVQQYAEFRASQAGGAHATVVVDIQQLYDQFAWGVNRHPLSIRNFGLYIKKHWDDPRYFLIIGKGREFPGIRTQSQLAAAVPNSFFVPTFGTPGADNLLLAGADGFTPVIPIGRIAATKPDDVRVYLDKVKQSEAAADLPQTIESRSWMKNILHLGGGSGSSMSEQNLLRSNLENFAEIAEAGLMGASVRGFYKTSTDPIQLPLTEDIFNYINKGLSMITFFGHSSVGVFDFSIDFPENYQNTGKYPWIISLGCYTGNIHTGSVGLGERFVFQENACARAFSATSGQAYIATLNTFTSKIYTLMGGDLYGAGIGDILKRTISDLGPGEFGINLIRQQFNLHGDPALRLNPAPGPDYLIDASTFKFSPANVAVNAGEVNISFDAVNLGRHTKDTVQLTIIQEFPDKSRLTVVDTFVPAPASRSHLSFDIPIQGKSAVGLNRFFVKIDASGKVSELPEPQAESNNELVMPGGETGASLFIRDNSAIPVHPDRFALAGPEVVLKAYTSDPLAAAAQYLMQIDTTALFNSPLMLQTSVSRPGGLIEWEPPLGWQDGTVYYWRVSPDSISPQLGYNWIGSSFTYRSSGGSGWSQSHYYQFKQNELINIELDGHDNMKFLQSFKEFKLRNAPFSVFRSDLSINNVFRAYNWGNPSAGIYIVWIDSVYLEPYWNSVPGTGTYSYGNPHPWGIDSHTFIFNSDAQGRKSAMDFLRDVVPAGEYVILFTVQSNPTSNFQPQAWAADSIQLGYNLFSVLEADGGAQLVRQLETTGSVPYAVAYRKGHGLLDEAIASTASEIIQLDFLLEGNWDRGFVNSPRIGPVKSWGELKWKATLSDMPETDTLAVQVYGIKPGTTQQVLLFDEVTDTLLDLSTVQAADFPFLQLRFTAEDSILRTSPVLNQWKVTYEPLPEFLTNAGLSFEMEADTVQEGADFKLKYAIENTAENEGDSLLVKYTLSNAENAEKVIFQRLGRVGSAAALIAQLSVNTRGLRGKQSLLAELNPDLDQPERVQTNNFLQVFFNVAEDVRNPLLDVTFDGMRISNGDLVSPEPVIQMVLKDENTYLLLNDSSSFRLLIQHPDSAGFTQYAMDSPEISFTPATSGQNNRAVVEFRPKFSVDGEYTLRIQASDASGNNSGAFDFKRSFKVVTKASISDFINYPNPFSTSTRFLYTLTGSEKPANYRMQIMTVSGRVVREVGMQELGELKAGTHLTDFAWDGRDEYGDQLANGVYLYRIIIQDDNGREWDRYETQYDQYSTSGFGKMVLIR